MYASFAAAVINLTMHANYFNIKRNDSSHNIFQKRFWCFDEIDVQRLTQI